MKTNKIHSDISYITLHSISASIIFIISIGSSFLRINYLIDPFLVPFVLVFFKLKKNNFSLLISIMISSVMIIFYKPRLILFLFSYMFIAMGLVKLRFKNFWKDIPIMGLIYGFCFYVAYLITYLFIYGYKLENFVSIFTGIPKSYFWFGVLFLIYEPLFYTVILVIGKKYIVRYL